MIHDNLQLHNISETRPWNGGPDVVLQRVPEAVCRQLNPRGRFVGQESAGTEIRFVTDAPTTHAYLSALRGDGEAVVYRGDFVHSRHTLSPGAVTSIPLDIPASLKDITPEALAGRRFHSDLWRIFIGRSQVVLHGVDTHGYACRPPEAKELPSIRWLAHGSSITNGGAAPRHAICYVQQAAWRLGVDVFNIGMSGSCHCETSMADWLAGRGDWDIATLELGINMCGGFTVDQFRERATYLVETMAAKNPGKPIVLLTVFPVGADHLREPNETSRRLEGFRECLRELHAKDTSGQIHLAEGTDILSDFCGLTCDLVHPSDAGMIQMGENLAGVLRPIIEGLGQ